MESIRPFITQLQLVRCQYKAGQEATTPIAKLSFVRGGFVLLGSLHRFWVQHELGLGGLAADSQAVERFMATRNTPSLAGSSADLPSSLISLQNSDWYSSFLEALVLLEQPLTTTPVLENSTTNNLIAVAKASNVLSLDRLGADIKGFERYFESQMNLSEEY